MRLRKGGPRSEGWPLKALADLYPTKLGIGQPPPSSLGHALNVGSRSGRPWHDLESQASARTRLAKSDLHGQAPLAFPTPPMRILEGVCPADIPKHSPVVNQIRVLSVAIFGHRAARLVRPCRGAMAASASLVAHRRAHMPDSESWRGT